MKKHFRVEAAAISRIRAASEDENPKQALADDLQTRIEDDFDYVLSGIERLGREGQLDEAIDIMEKLSATLDGAISVIGEDFGGAEMVEEEI